MRRTNMAKTLSGGGITSNKLVREGVRGGSPNLTAYSPRGVSQLGISQGSTLSKTGAFTTQNSALPLSDGQRRDFVPLGNQLATNVGGGGPGTGRTLYGQGGTQQMHGAHGAGLVASAQGFLEPIRPRGHRQEHACAEVTRCLSNNKQTRRPISRTSRR